jgi:hypothetical protein
LAVDRIDAVHRPSRLVGAGQWAVYHLFSLETLLVLFLYG